MWDGSFWSITPADRCLFGNAKSLTRVMYQWLKVCGSARLHEIILLSNRGRNLNARMQFDQILRMINRANWIMIFIIATMLYAVQWSLKRAESVNHQQLPLIHSIFCRNIYLPSYKAVFKRDKKGIVVRGASQDHVEHYGDTSVGILTTPSTILP